MIPDLLKRKKKILKKISSEISENRYNKLVNNGITKSTPPPLPTTDELICRVQRLG